MIVVSITLSGGIIAPEDLPNLLEAASKAVPPAGTEAVVLSGRMPVWAFAALAHLYHPRPWVGTFEPRLGAAVVVAAHVSEVGVGTVVALDDATTVEVVF